MQLLEVEVKKYLSKLWSEYRIEFVFLVMSTSVLIISLMLFLLTLVNQPNSEISFVDSTDSVVMSSDKKIFVDLSGAIEKPNIYQVDDGSRLSDVINMANGLSENADRDYFAKNFNLAKIVLDQEKIYIPTAKEVESGKFIITNGLKNGGVSITVNGVDNNLININKASINQLDSLPGIGLVTADKIINSRPFDSKEQLIEKKIVGQNVFNKIKDLITAP